MHPNFGKKRVQNHWPPKYYLQPLMLPFFAGRAYHYTIFPFTKAAFSLDFLQVLQISVRNTGQQLPTYIFVKVDKAYIFNVVIEHL